MFLWLRYLSSIWRGNRSSVRGQSRTTHLSRPLLILEKSIGKGAVTAQRQLPDEVVWIVYHSLSVIRHLFGTYERTSKSHQQV